VLVCFYKNLVYIRDQVNNNFKVYYMEKINKPKDVTHHIDAYFVPNTLPEAKKPFIVRAGRLPYLNVEEVATKAEIYGQIVDMEAMTRNVNVYLNICAYLLADGYGIENLLLRSRIRVPGEYDGTESVIPKGDFPEVRMNAALGFRDYIREHVKLDFKGVDETSGHMYKFLDEATGLDDKITRGNLFHVSGVGLKIAHDDEQAHVDACGLWLIRNNTTSRLRVPSVAVNEPRTIVFLVPANLTIGHEYYIEIVTQSSIRSSGGIIKNPRTVRSEHTFIVS
jgi:hypothetical protein